MVSTTLTAIAAGQQTSSSSNYHHHHQSSSATSVASSTANSNSNFQKAHTQQLQQHQHQHQHQHQQPQHQQHHSSSSTSASVAATSSTSPTTTTTKIVTNTQNSYYSYNTYTARDRDSDELYSVNSTATNLACDEQIDVDASVEADRNLSHQYHRVARGNPSFNEQAQYLAISDETEPLTTAAKTQRNEIVTLSQALLNCSSSPLNDQISLLFPKCRPKNVATTTSNGNSNSNGNETTTTTVTATITTPTTVDNYNNESSESELQNGVATPSALVNHLYKSESIKSPPLSAKAQTNNRNYYRSVNIITQSPPPPSTSSVSSESLSSVTPRISTNPFLCPADDDNDTNKLSKVHENTTFQEEDLPVPTYRSFYYHTSSSGSGSGSNVASEYFQKTPHHQPHQARSTVFEDSEDRSYEMPRKRTNYSNNSSAHAVQSSMQSSYPTQMMTADNHQRHQQLRQQQTAQHQQYNGIALDDNPTAAVQPTNPNPFIRDNYWEPTSRHNVTPSNTVLNSPETELPPTMYASTTSSSSLRRAYHQQTFNSSNASNETNILRTQHQQQQQQKDQRQARLVRGSINENDSIDESSTTSNHHFTDQCIVKSRSESHTPLVNHYMNIAKGVVGVGVGGCSVSGGVGGGANVGSIKERAKREQDVQEKRDVGQFQQLTQAQSQSQQQQQQQQQQTQAAQTQQKQLRQQHQSAHSMTPEGRFSMISNGEVLVFDDITESWQNLKVTTETNAPRLNNIAQNGAMAASPTSTNPEQTVTMTPNDSNIKEGNHRSNFKYEDTASSCREQKPKHTEKSILSTAMDARHAIIEYEGSPRRIGHAGAKANANATDDERMQPQNTARISTNYNNNNSLNSNSPQYPARPGFPQRIMSPPRESATNVKSHHHQAEQQQTPKQTFQVPPLMQQQSLTDNNAEDTSNDVSEIGTISDLTAPEILSGTTAAAVHPDSTQTSMTTAQTSTVTSTTPITGTSALTIPTKSSTFDYLYEFSETRKVLEEFFKCPSNDEKPIEDSSDIDSIDIQYEFHSNFDRDDDEDGIDAEEDDDGGDDGDNGDDDDEDEQEDVDHDVDDDDVDGNVQIQNQTTAQQQNQIYHHHQPQQQQQQQQPSLQQPNTALQSLPRYQYAQQQQQQQVPIESKQQQQPKLFAQEQNQYANQRRRFTGSPLMRDFDFFLDSASRSSGEQNDHQDGINHNQHQDGRNNYRYSPETTDYDSNCGDLDSLSGDMNGISTSCSNYAKFYASSMPVLEDGLSSGHTSDTENNNNINNNSNFNNILQQQQQQQQHNTGIHHAPIGGGISVLMDMKRVSTNNSINSMNNITASSTSTTAATTTTDGIATSEKYNSISPNILHDNGHHQRKLDSPISSTGLGLMDDQIREATGRGHMRNNQDRELLGQSPTNIGNSNKVFKNIDPDLDALYSINVFHRSDMVQMTPPPPAPAPHRKPNITAAAAAEQELPPGVTYAEIRSVAPPTSPTPTSTSIASAISSTLNRNRNASQNSCIALQHQQQQQHQQQSTQLHNTTTRAAYQTQPMPPPIPERIIQRSPSPVAALNSPVWLPRHLDNSANKSLLEVSSSNHSKNQSADEDDIDTDLETDRLLGHQRLDDQGYYDENKGWERGKSRSLLSKISPKQQQLASTKTRNGYNALLSSTPEIPPPVPPKNTTTSNKLLDISGSMSSPEHSDKSPIKSLEVQDSVVTMSSPGGGSNDSGCINGNGMNNNKKDLETMNNHSNGIANNAHPNTNGSNSSASGNESNVSNVGSSHASGEKKVKKSKNKEGGAVLIEGVLFRAKYLGSTQLVCEGQPTKSTRMMQAEEAVSRIKAPDSDVQPSTEVDLFISTEKIMVLNTDLKEIMMDHALRTISYIADIGDLVVLMARRRFVPQDIDDAPKPNRTPKMICHVFESDEAQFIAQSIGQAFQVAYMEFLKANGIEDHSFVKEMDYQEVLNSQEIFGDELEIFAKKELQKEVVVPKAKGEILGVVIVESGWGSMLPTVVIANLMSSGAAARCGQLNIGDQLIAINGLSLVGLPLSTCQNYIKNTKNQTVVKFTVVPCPPVVEVKIKRPNTKYQLGFSVQNGVICSLLRGGIAERGGVRVGHRIIEINNQSVVAVPHEKIVNLLATSVGEILMKTMPTSMFRLLTGQETPIYI